ncbi:hypothetical protein [Planococcus donghaensis]|uniref:Uncharacterized protein n=1 Tax=Planococcus donghaensis TaxID=414778 RepID=A0A1C7EKC9_9BACL|nr:hypothetical protein [Planococcus donghaensis]ANU24195.1 hypothetical protein BCM40_12905 [Planococcus donghaensis]
MKKFLYYPGFEIEDDEWLKFALLYMENVNTIVPEYASIKERSDTKIIKKYTDLLDVYHPKYDEGKQSSIEVMEIIDRFFTSKIYTSEKKMLDTWELKELQTVELYRGKYSHDFEDYCLEKSIATKTHNGILISKELSLAYMSIFAHSIGDRNGMSIITDVKDQQRLTLLNDHTQSYNSELVKLNTLKSILNINIPAHLKDVPLSDIISLRNKEDFQAKLKAFNKALNDFTSSTDQNLSEDNYKDFLDCLYDETNNLKSMVKAHLPEIISFNLYIGLTISNSASKSELLQNIVGASPLLFNSMRDVYKVYRNEIPNNLAPRYLTDLSNLGRIAIT